MLKHSLSSKGVTGHAAQARLRASTAGQLGFWATKKGHLVRSWKRRWFVCDAANGLVTYYTSQEAATPRGTIRVRLIERDGNDSKAVRVLCLSQKVFLLQMNAEDDVLALMKAGRHERLGRAQRRA